MEPPSSRPRLLPPALWVIFGAIVILFLLSGLSLWRMLSDFYTLAPPISLPETVQSVTVTKPDGSEVTLTAPEDMGKLLQTLSAAQPTRRQSLNDSPAVPNCGVVQLHTHEGVTTVFYYREDTHWYLEMPYTGIWRLPTE